MPRDNRKKQETDPKKKYQRSQSPAAKEKRKIQNRIAQRNHRRRLREKSNSVHSVESETQAAIPSSPINWASALSTDEMAGSIDATLTDASLNPFSATSIESYLNTIPANIAFQPEPNPFLFPFSEGCACSPVTGPCARHLDEIKFKMSIDAVNNPSDIFSIGTQPLVDPALSAVTIEGNSPSPFIPDPKSLPQPSPALPKRCDPSPPTSVPSTHSYRVEKRSAEHRSRSRSNTGSSQLSKRPSLSSSVDVPNSPNIGNNISSSRSSPMIPEEPPEDLIPQNTARFTKILAACREAGFPDFDTMASTYYTCALEKSSVPGMAQRASRTRRLPRVMKNLHTSSKAWPRWESRGIDEAATESAKSLYEEELQEVTQHLNQSIEGDGLSDFDALSKNSGAMSRDEENKLIAQQTTLPEEVESVVQEKAPRLWSLLTELAGPESLYCDRVSHAVVGLLINGRRNQWRN